MHGTLQITDPPNSLAAFYATQRGAVAAEVLCERLAAFWPDVRGMGVLGRGYAAPYLKLWQDTAYRCLAAVPAPQVPVMAASACQVDEDRLPFPDLSFDRILLIHAVEHADDSRPIRGWEPQCQKEDNAGEKTSLGSPKQQTHNI